MIADLPSGPSAIDPKPTPMFNDRRGWPWESCVQEPQDVPKLQQNKSFVKGLFRADHPPDNTGVAIRWGPRRGYLDALPIQ